jgi:hypothetical protein
MSEALYTVRLFWNGRSGIAKHDGAAVELRECPLGKRIAEVDFAPCVRVFQIRESADGWRDMTPAEIATCHALLLRLSHAARKALTP